MATVSLTDDFRRVDDLDDTTIAGGTGAVSNIGGGAGAGAEPDFIYQGTGSISRKVTSATGAGFWIDTGGVLQMSTSTAIFMAKLILTNKDALNSTGLRLRIGDTSSDYYEYLVADDGTVRDYPIKGGWLIFPINPTIAGYRLGTTGTPNLSFTAWFGITAAVGSTAKAENLCLDAIDVGYGTSLNQRGTGWYLVGGDGASADGVFQDFVDADEGDVTNGRYGTVSTIEGVLFIHGRLTIGRTNSDVTTATEFTDTGQTLVWQDNFTHAGWNSYHIELGNASTVISTEACTFISRGNTTTTDTRTQLIVTGTSGTFNSTADTYSNFAAIDLTSGATMTDCVFNDLASMDLNGGTIDGCVFNTPNLAANTACVLASTLANITDCVFNRGTNGHAIEIDTAGTYTLNGTFFNDYTSTSGEQAIWFNPTGGTGDLVINVTGGGNITASLIRNSSSGSVTVNNNTAITLTGMKDNTEVRVYDQSNPPVELAGIENATAGTTNNRSFTFSLAATTVVDIRIHSVQYEALAILDFTIPSTDTSIPISQRFDRNYDNP